MAKKINYQTSNNFDLEADLDIPQFDFDDDKPQKDDRKPITKAAVGFAKGVRDEVFSPNLIRSGVRNALPPAYGQSMDKIDDVVGSVRDVYTEAVKELKPAVKDLKRTTRKLLPKTEGILPKKLQGMLKEWSTEELEFGANLNQQKMRDQGLAIELGQIFQAQAEDTDRREELSQQKDELKESIAQMRHGQSIRQTAGLAQGIDRLVAYQDKILVNYQRKSLELQYRHFFATADMLELQREVARTQKTQLDDIKKNTGLPDFVKATKSEEFMKGLKNKFAGALGDGIFGGMRDYLSKFTKNVVANAKMKISDAINQVKDGAAMADMATDTMDTMGDMGDAMGVSQHEMGGQFAGSFVGEHLIDKGMKWVGNKIKDHPNLVKYGEKAHYFLNNAEHVIPKHLNSYDVNWGPAEGLRRFFAESAPSTQPDTALQSHNLMKMDDPSPFTRSASRSIIEIIPGYLARIHREIQVLRTGDESLPLTTYSYMSNKFSTVKATAKELKGRLFNKYEKDDVHEKLNKLVDFLDEKQSLSPDARAALKKELLTQSIQRKSIDATDVHRQSHWSATGPHAKAISQLFRNKLEVDPETEKPANTLSAIKAQNHYADNMKNLTSWVNDPREMIQQLRLLGSDDVLHELNMLDNKTPDKINLMAFRDMLMEEEPATHEVSTSQSNRLRKVRRPGQTPPSVGIQHARPVMSQVAQPYQPAMPVPGASTVQHDAMIDRLDHILEAVRRLDKDHPKDPDVATIKDTVLKIETQLQSGIKVANIDMEELTDKFAAKMGSHFGNAAEALKSGYGKAKDKVKDAASRLRFRDMTLGDAFTKVRSGLGKGAQFVKDKAKLMGHHGWELSKKWGTFGGAVLATGNRLVKAKLGEYYGDLYVGKEQLPRLTHARLQAGYYVDAASKKPIKSFKAIAGPVLDIGDNPQGVMVLTLDELKTAYLKGEYPQMLTSIAKGLGELTLSGLFKARGLLKGGFAVGVNLAIQGFQTAKKFLPPFDVYCKDNMKEPLLFATKMKLGDEYFSKKTGKPVKHPRDIDGVILDKDKNEVVTEHHIEIGLVDVNGIAVKNVAARVLRKVGTVLKAGYGMLKNVGSKVLDTFSGLGNYLRDMFGGIFGLRGEYLQTSKKQLDVLTQIYQLLDNRIPKNQQVREGSAQQQESQEAAREKEQAEEVATNNKQGAGGQGEKAEGGGLGIGGFLKGLFGKGKKITKGEGAAEVLENVAGGAAGEVAAKGAAKGGSALWRATKFLGGKAGKLGKFGLAALPWLATEAIPAAVGGVGAVLGGVGSLLGGAAALLSAPVLLTALGVAAVGYGAYKLYKYMSKMRLDTLSTLRYAQYGFPASDQDHLQAVFNLEAALMKNIKVSGDKATLDTAKVDLKDLASGFGVSVDKEDQFRPWLAWVNNRFKPVLLATLVNLKAINSSVELADVDKKLTPKEKTDFVDKLAAMSSGLYDQLLSPFPDLKNLTVDSNEVQRVIASTKAALADAAKKAAAVMAKGGPVLKTAAVTSALAAKNALDAKTQAKVGKDGQPMTPADAEKAKALTATTGALTNNSTTKLGVSAADGVSGLFETIDGASKLGALAAIRMKTYGLIDLVQDKVDALRAVEIMLSKQVKFSKEGASWNEDVEALLNYQPLAAKFGLPGPRSPQGYEWMSWFKFRFLPVYLNFYTAVWKATGKTSFETFANADTILKPEDALLAGNVLKTTMTVYNGEKVVVWKVKEMPWKDFLPNGDVNSVELNIDFLNDQVKKTKLTDQKQTASTKPKVPAPAANAPEAKKPATPPDAAPADKPQPRLFQKASDGNPNLYSASPSNAVLDKPTGFSGGAPITQPGEGTGGDINKLPDAKGSGWDNVKDLLAAVAKMVGVDPQLLAKFAAMESGFDPHAIPRDKNGNRLSNAMGLFQFIPSTWNLMMRKFANKYGINPMTPPSDARANALMGAEFLKGNARALQKSLGRPGTDTDLYLAHFLGEGGADKFLKSNPQAAAADVMPKEAAANPTIFYKGGMPTTFAQIYESFTNKLKAVGAKFKFGSSGSSTTTPVTDAAAPEKPNVVKSAPAPSKASQAAVQAATAPAKAAATAPVQDRPKLFTPETRDQANLGATAPTTPLPEPTPETAPAAPMTPPKPVMRPVPNFSGFSPQQDPVDTKTQSEVLHAKTNDQMQILSKLANSQLQMQMSMDATLKELLRNVINMKQTQAQKSAQADDTAPDPAAAPAPSAAKPKSARFASTMQDPPVSMDRKW